MAVALRLELRKQGRTSLKGVLLQGRPGHCLQGLSNKLKCQGPSGECSDKVQMRPRCDPLHDYCPERDCRL
ncbi:hypothetical protein SKAU_G00105420 [Synaphobranchus kaupii]|uniref:Uncharacterized protein n=1 Tax=Synaphobranchus kaupii TaxID=118154 RepID=A0A9Q1G022_SYNKA|nr:hypothetical protein SKAU_G00105420 [Synaphobranchus kaupii]